MLNDDELKEIAKDELKTLEEEKENIEKNLEVLLIPKILMILKTLLWK